MRFLPYILAFSAVFVLSCFPTAASNTVYAANPAARAGYDDASLIAKYRKAEHSSRDSVLLYAASMTTVGERNGDCLLQAYGNALAGRYHLHKGNTDSALLYLNRALMLPGRQDSLLHAQAFRWIKADIYNNLALFHLNWQLDYFKALTYLLKALDYADDTNDRLPIILANIVLVHSYRNDTTGMEYALRLKEYSERTGSAKFLTGYSLALMDYICGRPADAEEHIGNAVDVLEADSGNGGPHYRELIMSYNLYAKIMLSTKRVKEAMQKLEMAKSIKYDITDCDISDTYLTFGYYFLDNNMPDEAISILLEGVRMCDSTLSYVHLGEIYQLISELYENKGDYRKALEYDRLLRDENRRMYDRRKEYDLTEIKTKYKLEQYQNTIKEKEIEVLKRDRFLILLTAIIVIVVTILLITWYSMRKKSRYYEKIVQQYTKNASLNKRIRELENQNQKYVNSTLSDTKGDDLYDRLTRMMNVDRIYRDQDLSVDKLAVLLDTNRTYLSRIINERTGMNFNKYINKYRVDEAVSVIMETHGQCLLKSLAFDLGFKTTSSFYKAFSNETGMPPAAFRDKCMSEKQ